MTDLFAEIERAEQERDKAEHFQQALVELSRNEAAALILTAALRDSSINCENLWRALEQRDDFKAEYGADRAKAREDFLFRKKYF